MGFVRTAWKIRRMCRHWRPLAYILLGILGFQVFFAFNSGPNLLEEEKMRQLKQSRIDRRNAMAHDMLKGEKSILARNHNEDGFNAHDPNIRERFIRDAKNIDVLEDYVVKNSLNMNKKNIGEESDLKSSFDKRTGKVFYEKPYKPSCDVTHKDALSAISRAKTNACKQEIADTACMSQNNTLFPESMPRYCPHPGKYTAQAPIPQSYDESLKPVRICYMLVVHGRAIRQFKRLFKLLYHKDHFYYIHVDKRSDFLHREILQIATKYSNVQVAPWRMATIWGGSSLLQMLLRAMKDVVSLWSKWDFFVNLSALDFPVETHDKFVSFMTKYRDKNFMKSHGRDDEKFIRKQGLNRVFVECETHMWRLGERELPKGITLNGGSDWVALNREYCDYVINGNDQLLTDLKHWYKYTLLPAESFFHTLAQNSDKCESFVDNNLRVTNWNRARGCKCQYKHIVDWCGCSPNDFFPQDLTRLQTSRPVFFARKFEESINQEVVNHLDFKLYGEYPSGSPSIRSYWENIYDYLDETLPSDSLLTHYHSFARLGLSKINPVLTDDTPNTECFLRLTQLKTVEMYRYQEEFKGYVVTFDARWMQEDKKHPRSQSRQPSSVTLQTLVPRKQPLEILDSGSTLASRLEWAAIGTNWDVKELVLRDWGGIIGPLSEPRLVAKWSNSKEDFIVTVVLIDPLNVVADYNDFRTPAKTAGVTDTPLNLQKPLRPGKWKVRFYAQRQFQKAAAELSFIVAPLRYRDGAVNDVSLVTDNRGVTNDDELNSARRNLYSIRTTLNLRRDYGAEASLEERAAYVGEDLESWIDEVVADAWTADSICLASSDGSAWSMALPRETNCYTKHRLSPKLCKNVAWSSLYPDPKSELTNIKSNGRIR
ncbi:xylosyltransferase-like isoform X1 [Styela clava]